jgi:hypothetical protein
MADVPPASPVPSAAPDRRPRTRTIVVLGIVGALIAAGIGTAVALQLAEPDIAPSALQPEPSPTLGPRPDAVTGLAAEADRWTAEPGPWAVMLAWDEPSDAVDRFVISRDGERVGSATQPTFVDEDVEPEGRYRYEVVSVVAGRSSAPSRLSFQADPLPLTDALLGGRWVLRMSIESSSIGAPDTRMLVRFEPGCDVGACEARWSFTGRGNTGTATRSGVGYSGTGSGSLFTRDCHGGTVSATSVTLDLTIVEAHTIGDVWRASEIRGTVRESVPAVSNCLSASNTWSFRGEVQG